MITFFKIFFCLTLACFTGLMYYHSLQRFFRIIMLQLIIAIIAQALGVVYDKHHLQENQLIYNAYILLEVWILTAANATYLNSKKEKIIMLCGLVAFGVAMGYDV